MSKKLIEQLENSPVISAIREDRFSEGVGRCLRPFSTNHNFTRLYGPPGTSVPTKYKFPRHRGDHWSPLRREKNILFTTVKNCDNIYLMKSWRDKYGVEWQKNSFFG